LVIVLLKKYSFARFRERISQKLLKNVKKLLTNVNDADYNTKLINKCSGRRDPVQGAEGAREWC